MRDADRMRTTLTLDDDVLEAARKLSEARGIPIGAVVSELARRGLAPARRGVTRNGIRLFPVRRGAGAVTPETVKELLEEVD
jgi:hypothetical protein